MSVLNVLEVLLMRLYSYWYIHTIKEISLFSRTFTSLLRLFCAFQDIFILLQCPFQLDYLHKYEVLPLVVHFRYMFVQTTPINRTISLTTLITARMFSSLSCHASGS